MDNSCLLVIVLFTLLAGTQQNSLIRVKHVADTTNAPLITTEKGALSREDAIEVANTINEVMAATALVHMTKTDIRWEELLLGAPVSVFLINMLMGLAQKQDFKLTLPKNISYTILRHETFAPTVVQISNEAWFAFQKADKNMDIIRVSMETVPDHVQDAMGIIGDTPVDHLANLVETPLSAINRMVQKSTKFAAETLDIFTRVITLLSETQEAVVASKSTTEARIKELERLKIANDIANKSLELLEDRFEEELAAVKEEKKVREEAYKKAIENLPSSWQIVGMEFVRSLGKMVESIVPAITAIAGNGNPLKAVQQHAHLLSGAAGKIGGGITSFLKDGSDLLKASENNADMVYFKKIVSEINNVLHSSLEKYKQSAAYDQLKSVAGNSSALADAPADNLTRFEELKENLFHAAKTLEIQGERQNSEQPEVKVMAGPQANEAYSLGQNERVAAEQARQLLSEVIERDKEYFKKLVEIKENRTQIMITLCMIKFDTADFEKILDVITQAITVIADLRAHWAKLVYFFTFVSRVIEHQIAELLTNFGEYAGKVANTTEKQKPIVLRSLKNPLRSQAQKLSVLAMVSVSICTNYLNVSRSHVLPLVVNASKILVDKAGAEAAIRDFAKHTEAVDKQIMENSHAGRQKLLSYIQMQNANIDRIFEKLGNLTATENSTLSDGVKGFGSNKTRPIF